MAENIAAGTMRYMKLIAFSLLVIFGIIKSNKAEASNASLDIKLESIRAQSTIECT